jgi:hypothetical protein
LTLDLFNRGTTPGADVLRNATWEGRDIGLQTSTNGSNMRSWVLFPTMHLPMQATSLASGILNVRVAPYDGTDPPMRLESTIMELDEIHLVRAARLYRSQPPDPRPNELRRVIFDTDDITEVLARDIVGLQFVFDPETRLLTMHMAARGHEVNPRRGAGAGGPSGWPSGLPGLDAEAQRYRVIVKALTWRVRN